MAQILGSLSVFFMPAILSVILLYGMWKKAPVYDYFVEGAKEGLKSAANILPFIIAIFIGLESLKASGALDFVEGIIAPVFQNLGIPEEMLPLILLRPVSGSGSLVILESIVAEAGADSFAAKASAVMMGSCETVFYVLAVYFGATRVKHLRHTLPVGMIAYVAGIFISIWICGYIF